MAIRFLGIAGQGVTARTAPPDLILTETHSVSGFSLSVSPGTPCVPLPNGYGLVIGHLFRRIPFGDRVEAFTSLEAYAILVSQGETLIDQFWGGYVAFLTAAGRPVICVRDPSGTLPCLIYKSLEATHIASDVGILRSQISEPFKIDWPALKTHLSAPDFRTAETCLTGILELLPGHRYCCAGSLHRSEPLWSPWDYITPPTAEPSSPQRLRDCVTTVVEAWSKPFHHVLQGLSGGLDSSTVTAALSRSDTKVTCLTMATDEAEGDERQYARIVAKSTGVPLLERFHQMGHIDIMQPASVHLPRPVHCAFGESERQIKFALARELGLDAFFSGIGGDNVFCHMRSPTPILDRALATGIGRGVLNTIDDVCTLTECSLPQAIGGAMARWAQGTTYRWVADTRWLRSPAHSHRPLTHPWLTSPPGMLPGKAAHVAKLLRVQGTIDGYPRSGPPQILPLLAQPIVELCLGIPTWDWVRGGRDRAVAREAFEELLPPDILRRRSKGGPNSFAYAVVDDHRERVRDLVLTGVLVEQKIVDADALAKAIPADHPIPVDLYMRLSIFFEAEMWCRHILTPSLHSEIVEGI